MYKYRSDNSFRDRRFGFSDITSQGEHDEQKKLFWVEQDFLKFRNIFGSLKID